MSLASIRSTARHARPSPSPCRWPLGVPVWVLREMVPVQGERVRGFQWIVAYASGVLIAAVGGGAWMLMALSA